MPRRAGDRPWTVWHSASLLGILAAVFIVELLLPTAPFVDVVEHSGAPGMFAVVAGHGVTGLWLGLLIDTRNKASLSRLQMTLWTILILSGFLAAVITNIDSGQPATGDCDPAGIVATDGYLHCLARRLAADCGHQEEPPSQRG